MSAEPTTRAVPTVRVTDRFDDDRATGSVIGSIGPLGARRLGIDVEGRLAIDNGALRIRPLEKPGWGREGIAYGPFERRPGLAFAAHVLNGHNASQTFYFPETTRQRLRRVLGDLRRGRLHREHHYENLAVGFLPSPDAADPLGGAHTFVMHAATEDNGELWTAVAGRAARVARGVLNLPFVFVVALRPDGAAYYTASLPGACGAAPYPSLRPLGLDTRAHRGPVFAGIQQRILGEVGYRVDSRVYGTEVAAVDEWSAWCGSASAADRLVEDSPTPLDGRVAERGGAWEQVPGGGRLITGGRGAVLERPDAAPGAAQLRAGARVGLLHAIVGGSRRAGALELRWRCGPDGACLAAQLDAGGARVVARDAAGRITMLAEDRDRRVRLGARRAVQVLDDGGLVAVHVDGKLVGDGWLPVHDLDDPDDGVVGIRLEGASHVCDLEAHDRHIRLPDELDAGAPWTPPASAPVFEDRFDAVAADLAGTASPSAGRRWERALGKGRIEVTGAAARVAAARERPNPGRTVYTVDWEAHDFADLSLEMTVPGAQRGEGHNGRCGVVFWQDPDNYLVVNVFVDDVFDGASISTFYHLRGEEVMYDAVWTLVRGVEWGRRCTLRAAFDGERFLAFANGEPALVRALQDVYPDAEPLRIRRVGIIVNREWGDDTGTVIHRFTAGRRAESR